MLAAAVMLQPHIQTTFQCLIIYYHSIVISVHHISWLEYTEAMLTLLSTTPCLRSCTAALLFMLLAPEMMVNHCACPYVLVFVCAERQEVSGENTDPHSLFDYFLLQFFCIPSTKTQTWNCFCFNVICHLSFIHFAQGFCAVLTFARLHIKRHLIVLGARERIRDHSPSRLRKTPRLMQLQCIMLCSL